MAKKKTSAENEAAERYKLRGHTDEEAELVVTELRKIAKRHEVSGIEFLDPEVVFEEIWAVPAHPLRAFIKHEGNGEAAARQFWIGEVRRLVRSVRVYYVNVSRPKAVGASDIRVHTFGTTSKEKLSPLWAAARKQGKSGYSNVVKTAEHDAVVFSSMVGTKITCVRNAVRSLAEIAAKVEGNTTIATLATSLQEALDEYDAEGMAHAAEE